MGDVEDTYEEPNEKIFEMTIINANARSLCPKIDSLITCMDEMEASIGVVTETWFRDSPELEDDLADLQGRAGLSMLKLCRAPNAQGVSHGGVGIAYNQNKCTLTRIDLLNPCNWEILAAKSRFVGFHRPVVVIACYVPPSYSIPRGTACLSFIRDTVTEMKRVHDDPYVVIAGTLINGTLVLPWTTSWTLRKPRLAPLAATGHWIR